MMYFTIVYDLTKIYPSTFYTHDDEFLTVKDLKQKIMILLKLNFITLYYHDIDNYTAYEDDDEKVNKSTLTYFKADKTRFIKPANKNV